MKAEKKDLKRNLVVRAVLGKIGLHTLITK
jgi:hypothetical protein